jgi:hypothetical protein
VEKIVGLMIFTAITTVVGYLGLLGWFVKSAVEKMYDGFLDFTTKLNISPNKKSE